MKVLSWSLTLYALILLFWAAVLLTNPGLPLKEWAATLGAARTTVLFLSGAALCMAGSLYARHKIVGGSPCP